MGLAAAAALAVSAWAGLARLGVEVGRAPVSIHAPLMVLGFLGTMIAAERAVGIGGWAWTSPLAAATGVAALLLERPGATAVAMSLAGVLLVAVYVTAVRMTGLEAHLVVMGMGAVGWVLVGGGLLLANPVPTLVPAMAAFLVLTICGERLELSRMGPPRSRRWVASVVGASCLPLAAGAIGLAGLDASTAVAGAGMVALAVLCARGDVARRTIRGRGVTRYMAAALLAGYLWLGVAGALWAVLGLDPGTLGYDAAIHTLFIGFVLSMVFAHAPVIVPAVARIDLPYHPAWWGALALLHGSLLLRVTGDALGSTTMRAWGGVGNVAAIAAFLALAAGSAVVAARQPAGRGR